MFIRNLSPTVKTGLILAGGALLLGLVYHLSGVIAPFLVSLVLAYILNPTVRVFERRGIPRAWAVLMIYILGFVIGILVIVPVTFTIAAEGSELAQKLSQLDVRQIAGDYHTSLREMYAKYADVPWLTDWVNGSVDAEKIRELAARAFIGAKDTTVTLSQKLFNLLMSAFTGAMDLLLIPLLTFYMLVDLDLIWQRFLLFVPPLYRDSTLRITGDIDRLLSSFLRGQLICALVFALLTTFGLWLAGLPFAFLLGPIAGVGNMIPYLGGLVSIVLATIVALATTGASTATAVTLVKAGIALAIIQTIDGFLVQPRVMEENLGIHPLTIMLALVIGGSVFGFLGMLLAIPATCVVMVLSRELYHELYDTP
ncbi:MAG TPA: AI-2E family transporter [Candidatus Ozemobacteraceae bacterium]|nr:AI-2E family transporter [Candidatus Ozemobacteraceae bacterium]